MAKKLKSEGALPPSNLPNPLQPCFIETDTGSYYLTHCAEDPPEVSNKESLEKDQSVSDESSISTKSETESIPSETISVDELEVSETEVMVDTEDMENLPTITETEL
jgi:hypothetical protein